MSTVVERLHQVNHDADPDHWREHSKARGESPEEAMPMNAIDRVLDAIAERVESEPS